MNRQTLAIIALFCVALFYAGNYTVAKTVTPEHISPFGLTVFRVMITGAVLWIVASFLPQQRPMQRADLGHVALAAFCGVGLNMMTYMWGLSMTTPISASVLMITTPMIVIVLSTIFFGERLHWHNVVGILIGFVGAAMLILTTTTAQANASNPVMGNILILVNATSYSFYILLAKRLMAKYDPLTLLKWMCLFGMLYITPFGWSDALAFVQQPHSTSVYMGLGYVILFATIGTYSLNIFALSIVRPSIVAVFIYLQPLLATGIAIGAGSDHLNLPKIVAGALIFLGVYLTTRRVGE